MALKVGVTEGVKVTVEVAVNVGVFVNVPGAVGLAQANLRVPALSTGSYAVTFTLDGVAANSASVVVWSPN